MRKTRDIWEIQGNYGFGWDTECTEDTWEQAKRTFREYQANVDAYGVGRTRLVKHRIPIEAAQ